MVAYASEQYSLVLRVTVSEATLALFLFVAGVVTLACAVVAALQGMAWQAVSFGAGGLYVVVWSGLRLVPAEAERRQRG